MKSLNIAEKDLSKEIKKSLYKVKSNKRKYVAIFLLVSILFPFILMGLTFLALFIIGLTGGFS